MEMVDRGCIKATQMNSVLDAPTREQQNRVLRDALKLQGLASLVQIVDCFRHSRENAALLWVLEHEGGFLFLSLRFISFVQSN